MRIHSSSVFVLVLSGLGCQAASPVDDVPSSPVTGKADDLVGDADGPSSVALFSVEMSCKQGSASEQRTCDSFGCRLWSTTRASSVKGVARLALACDVVDGSELSCRGYSSSCVSETTPGSSWWITGAPTMGTLDDGKLVLVADALAAPYVGRFDGRGTLIDDGTVGLSSLSWSHSYTQDGPSSRPSPGTSTRIERRAHYWKSMRASTLADATLVDAVVGIDTPDFGPVRRIDVALPAVVPHATAEAVCADLDGALAVPDPEAFWLGKLGAAIPDTDSVWVNGALDVSTGEFRFMTGGPVPTSYWAPGQPGDGACVALGIDGYRAEACDAEHATLCSSSLSAPAID